MNSRRTFPDAGLPERRRYSPFWATGPCMRSCVGRPSAARSAARRSQSCWSTTASVNVERRTKRPRSLPQRDGPGLAGILPSTCAPPRSTRRHGGVGRWACRARVLLPPLPDVGHPAGRDQRVEAPASGEKATAEVGTTSGRRRSGGCRGGRRRPSWRTPASLPCNAATPRLHTDPHNRAARDRRRLVHSFAIFTSFMRIFTSFMRFELSPPR